MWVTLEYLQSNDVVILTQDYTICDANARDLNLLLDDTHSKWVNKRSISEVTQDIWKQNTTLKRMTSWTDMEAWKNPHNNMHRTLGWAIGILGLRQCRRPRDYFLALGKMLDFRPDQDPLVLIEDRFQYFYYLATHALRCGDYTPLLFIPPSDEPRDLRAPWLRGYSTVLWKLWDMGRCHRKATHKPIMSNGTIQLQLETVGIVESFEYYDFGEDAASVIDFVASEIVRTRGRNPRALCEAMSRVFPLDERKAVNMDWRDGTQGDDFDPTLGCDLTKLQTLLEEYGPLVDSEVGVAPSRQRLELAKKMITVLKLSKRGKHARESRLEAAAGEADWFLREYGKAMEGIGRIRCKICGCRSVFRLTMWEEPAQDVAQVYRIPGLVYDDTVPDGVGIVVQRKLIMGKMMYGMPSCQCRRLETVAIGSTKL